MICWNWFRQLINLKLLALQKWIKKQTSYFGPSLISVALRRVLISPGSSSRKNLFMHENTSKLAHTSVVGEAPSTVIYVLAWRNLFAVYSNFSSRISRCMNIKCYTFACEVLISSRVDTTSCKLLFNCTRKITNSVWFFFFSWQLRKQFADCIKTQLFPCNKRY